MGRLTERGLLSGAEVTDRAISLLEAIEEKTDELDAAPWDRIGVAGVSRVIELGASLGA